MIYHHDHAPAHVHVIRAGGQVVINLNPISIREFYGISKSDVHKAVAIIEANQDDLLERWNEING